jgi:hypothetical protein
MNYTRIALYDPETDCWAGYFAEIGKWPMTQGERGTLAELGTWFELLLDDLQAWADEGVIEPLPEPYEAPNCLHWILEFEATDNEYRTYTS